MSKTQQVKKKKHTKKSEPRRRGPPGWVTVPMATHLTGEISAYRAAQASGTLHEFWPGMHSRFAVNFPVAPLTAEEIAKGKKLEDKILEQLKKLKIWFNNNGRVGTRGGEMQLLNLKLQKDKPRKRLSLTQAYSKRYYPTKLKPIVESRYLEHLDAVDEGHAEEMRAIDYRNKIIKELWDNEPQEVKDEITEYREYHYQHGSSSEEDDNDDNDDFGSDSGNARDRLKNKAPESQPLTPVEAKAKEYNEAQNAAQKALTPILKELHTRTGYVGALVLAAPDGARGGQLSTVTMFIGKTPQSLDWGQHYTRERWNENIESPLIDFATLMYPPEAREMFRLLGTSLHVSASGKQHQTLSQFARRPSLAPSHASASTANSPRKSSGSTSNSRPGTITEKMPEVEANTSEEEVDEDDADDEEEDDDWPWRQDEQVTLAERASIESEGSHYEMMRAYRIILGQWVLNDLVLKKLAEEVVSTPRNFVSHSRTSNEAPAVVSPSNRTSAPSRVSSPFPFSPPRVSPGSPRPPSPLRLPSPRPPPSPGLESPRSPLSPALESPRPPPSFPTASGLRQRLTISKPTKPTNLASLWPSLADTHPTRTKWPNWMTEMVRAMEEYGPSSDILSEGIEAWVEFEDLMDYPDKKGKNHLLSTQGRPHKITKWIKEAHKAKDMPDITISIDRFGREWQEWWSNLQPTLDANRQPDDARDISLYSGLRKAGKNGLFLVIVSLVWWGAAAAHLGEEKMDIWRVAAEEFRALVKFFNDDLRGSGGRKRVRDSTENESGVHSKKRHKHSQN
ncbi:hypothetical protein HWV62_11950 [Athelia sp. TMB]|nr:hypothetical protein HWV62_11950 [Athelia sp. TMB]